MSTSYERAEGERTYNDLVAHFYALVAVNPICDYRNEFDVIHFQYDKHRQYVWT